MTDPNEINEELSEEQLKDMSGGIKGRGRKSMRKTSLSNFDTSNFSQGQTSFTELGSIERNAGLRKRDDSLNDIHASDYEHG